MKFTLSWLKEHLDTEASLEEIVETLTRIGLEVEGVFDPATKLASFTVARVVSAERHPDADKLQVCQVDAGTETVQVVCGAPNARIGMKGVFAPVGAYVPGIDLTITKARIRGVESNGMLLSERELELSDEHHGIIELPGDAEVGSPAAAALGLDDPVIEVAVTPNRPDCLGVRGIARDLAAADLGAIKPDSVAPVPGRFASPVAIQLDFAPGDANACPIFAGRVIRSVRNGPSPDWLQHRLRAIGLRPINALVDITNYIGFDRARPLHVYDADRLQGAIRARLGREREGFLALDGKTYAVDASMCVIADDRAVLGLGGVMGGAASGATEATSNVFVESAYFDPARTAATGRKLGIQSDARFRFERGVDPAFVAPGLELATQMILGLCGGEPGEVAMAGALPAPRASLSFDPGLVKRLAGLDLERRRILDILAALGFAPQGEGASLALGVPTWRPDVSGPADLVEEIVRIVGVDRVPATAMPRLHGVARPVLTEAQRRRRLARRVLAARGMVEAVTWSFVSPKETLLFGGGSPALTLDNPISSELAEMRPSLLPGLVAAAKRNRDRAITDGALFELGQIYRGVAPEEQDMAVAGLRLGSGRSDGAGRHWDGVASPVGVFDAKADVLAVLAALGLGQAAMQVARDAPPWFHPGRSGALTLGPKVVLGHFGELHPKTLAEMDVVGPIAGFELVFDRLPAPKKRETGRAALDAADLQPVRRDFAFVLDRTVPAGDVLRAARGAERKLIADVRVFDVFEGAALGDGKKSLAIEVTLQPRDRTLTDAEIEEVGKAVVAAVQKATGGVLRQ